MDEPVAIITGAGRGIGRATAVELARRGYRLALAARGESELRETATLVGGADVALAIPADVTRVGQVESLVAGTLDRFGRLDAVVNNAGLAPLMPFERMTTEQWHATIDTNLSATFFLSRAAWPALKVRGGCIVNLSSMASRDPFAGFAAYGAAKAGVNLFSLALAREGAPHKIRVHCVAPAAVETGMFRALMTPEQFPADKTLEPAEVARVIAQCVCGDLRHTSGETIYLHKAAV